jgi:two-component system chemotaxis sensor kinase CheA
MNELLASFVVEARDLLAEAGDDLLTLERMPADEAAINRLFRSVHTLKGSSGLFEVAPLTRVLHAAEDMFQAVREHGLKLTPDMVDLVLKALDQTAHWIDHLERHETLPANADTIAKSHVAGLRAKFGRRPGEVLAKAQQSTPAQSAPPGVQGWFDADIRQALAAAAGTVQLVSYAPEEGCFYKGEDPLHLVLQIPHLQALASEVRSPWPSLSALDPFSCNLVFHALSTAPSEEIEALFRYVPEQMTLTALAASALASAPSGPAARHKAGPQSESLTLLLAQLELLGMEAPENEADGRLAAAGRVAEQVLRGSGADELAAQIARASAAALAARQPEALCRAIEAACDALRAEPSAGAAVAAEPAAEAASQQRAVPRTLRVDQEKIDAMMNLVGELIVAKNSLPFLARRAEQQFGVRELSRDIREQYGVIDRIALELQGAVMAVRMMPIGQVFQRFPRLVRDLSRKLGKQVELVIEGAETEADKNVIENLFDPLLHMVRNSLDHGVETPDERRGVGKNETAQVALAARYDSDQVVIEITDDGRGIDPERVRNHALKRGLIDADQCRDMDDDAARMLIFAPGFSTAAEISDVSGRGVGMDAVRNAVEKSGGRLALSSRTGEGTTVQLFLPLSMAVSRVMTVSLGEQVFGIPMDLILETVRVPARDLVRIKTSEAFVLRDRVVPLLRLDRLLQLPPADSDESGDVAVLVVRMRGQIVGLAITAFGEGMEVILKPLEGMLAKIDGYAGTALLGDGRVLLVLDLKEIIP